VRSCEQQQWPFGGRWAVTSSNGRRFCKGRAERNEGVTVEARACATRCTHLAGRQHGAVGREALYIFKCSYVYVYTYR
jgi:hypothetical protein